MRSFLFLGLLAGLTTALATISPATESKLKQAAREAGVADPVILTLTPQLKTQIQAQAEAFGIKCNSLYLAYYTDNGLSILPMNYEDTTQKLKAGILESLKAKPGVKVLNVATVSRPFPDVKAAIQAAEIKIYLHTFMRKEGGYYRYYTYTCYLRSTQT